MNYSQKRALIGRLVYVGLTLMAVTVLCVTMFTFFGGSKRSDKTRFPITTSERPVIPDTEDRPQQTLPPVTQEPPASTDSTPTVKPEKDWMAEKITMPANGVIVKDHDLLNAVYSATMNDYRVHKGVDIECELGESVVSCADGVVKSAGTDPFMGVCVIIDHGDGLTSVYKNLSAELAPEIKEGASVSEGQVIGTVGESAIIEIADEPHLHFELELNGQCIDPAELLDYEASAETEK